VRKRDARVLDAIRSASSRWEMALRSKSRWDGKGRPGDHVVSRCLAIVWLLAEHDEGLRAEEIADKLGVSRPTVNRDLAALEQAGVQIARVSLNEHGIAVVRRCLGAAKGEA
jgi:biotin operon repressor